MPPFTTAGSSLGALLDDAEMEKILASDSLFKSKEFNVASCYSMGGKRIFYHEIFKNPPHDLAEAIKRVTPKIEMAQIHGIVDSTPVISEARKAYLKKSMGHGDGSHVPYGDSTMKCKGGNGIFQTHNEK